MHCAPPTWPLLRQNFWQHLHSYSPHGAILSDCVERCTSWALYTMPVYKITEQKLAKRKREDEDGTTELKEALGLADEGSESESEGSSSESSEEDSEEDSEDDNAEPNVKKETQDDEDLDDSSSEEDSEEEVDAEIAEAERSGSGSGSDSESESEAGSSNTGEFIPAPSLSVLANA